MIIVLKQHAPADKVQAFCKELNTYRIKKSTHAPWHMFDAFKVDEMNKLAFWCATGSGKTLMMHIHLKQYLYYCEKYGPTALYSSLPTKR